MSRRRESGFSYAELLVAIALVAVLLTPAMQAVQTSALAAAAQRDDLANRQRIKARMEEVLARPYVALDAAAVAAGNSPSATIADLSDAGGTPAYPPVQVTIYRYDGSAPSAADAGLLWVRVFIDSARSLDALRGR